ncbi:hypothetical protein SLS60_000051 [Paraconiothyrium brasiliense]|uniref:NACHT domain-containing protein n=1 Tax=Paraconiothyrium brasiliense TaxID=300254 RepID=A0ABR3S549_9PLEO
MVREPGVKDITSVLKILEKDSYTGEHYDIPYEAFPYLNSFHTFDYDSILDNIIDPYRHTCTWIPKSQAFLKWIAGESSTTFWLHGYPGLGKSVITKYLLKNFIDIPPADKRSRRCVLHFFCSYNLSNAQSYKGMLSSLIYQLLSQRPDLAGHATSLKNQFGWIDPDVDSLTNLHKTFADLLYWYTNPGRNMTRYGSLSAVPTLYIVIDALDELNRSEWSRFFETFGEILHGRLHGTKNTLIRLLITSRTEPEFENHLAKVWDIDLGATDQNASDVVEYIKGTVSDFGHENNFGDENIHEIISEISTKAEGMFLWATLAWSLFTDGIGMWTRGLVQRKLEGLRQVPAGIESLYHRVLGLLDKRIAIELLAALKWIVAAPVPLSVDDIAVALSLRTRPRNSRQLDIPFNMRRFFKKACPHLIKVDEAGLIKLVHLSFRTYLLETEFANIGSQKIPNPFHFALDPINYDIGLDCLSYITLNDFAKESLEEAQQHLFFSYCHSYWIHHLQSIKDGFDNVFVYFFKLFNFETKKLRWYDTSKMIFQLWDSGLSRLFEPAARFGMDLNVFDESGDHFIHHVCNGPNGIEVIEDTTRWLVDLGVDLNGRTYFGQTLLHRCLMNWHDALCHPDIDTPMTTELIGNIVHIKKRPFEIALDSARDSCRRLLSHPSIDLNAPDSFRFSPLSYAIYWGMTDAMNMLLACPYLRAEKGHSALHIAAKEGLYDAVEQLLKRGTDVYGRNSQGETALHLAAARGHFRILQLLVSYADPTLLNAKDRIIDPMSPYANGYIITTEANGWTPLHLAVTSGHDDLVLWLINHPWIDLHIKDKHGRKAIAFAAAFGTKSMLKAFLARDPSQVSHEDLFGNGLLHMASWGSNRENFDLLFSLDVTPAFGPNKWGNSIVDLAPTLAVDQHLHELGFVHSEARKASCLVVLGRHLQINKLTLEELTHRKYQSSEPQDLTGSKMIMVLPGSAKEYRDYAFRTVEVILDWISYTGNVRWYAFRTADIILKRLSITVERQAYNLTFLHVIHEDDRWTLYGPDNGMQRFKDIFARQGRFEAGYDQKDDLQKLKDNIDCLLAADDDWKDDLRRLKGRLDLL